jgi:hypothetical protein
MSRDRFTVVSRESWLSRIGGAVTGVLLGLVLFGAAVPLLVWNEGRSVKRHKTLPEGSGSVLSVAADRADAANEGRLIHLSGRPETPATLTDPAFGVSAPVLKLCRAVEMYQWQEQSRSLTKEKHGGGTETVTTYAYSKAWSSRPVDASGFKEPQGHQNPGAFPYPPLELTAEPVTLGGFVLPPSLVAKIGADEPLSVGEDVLLPERPQGARLAGGGFYVGANPASPQVGDLRVTFRVARPADFSVVARQSGATLAPYVTRAGGSIELLQPGVHAAAAMFEKAQQDARLITWLVRLGGFLLMLFGLNLVFGPRSVLASVVPLAGRLVGAGTGVVAFLLASLCALATVAVAWALYRPALGAALLGASALAAVALARRLRDSKVPDVRG